MRSSAIAKSTLTVICMLLACPAWAQSATVATYASAATDPNTAKPLSAQTYTPTCNLTPKVTESSPIHIQESMQWSF